MSENSESKWNIRFGQIFRQRVSAVETYAAGHTARRLQDVFFFHPEEENIIYLEKNRQTPYAPLDLNENTAIYRKYFAPQMSRNVNPLHAGLAKKLDATFILIPSYGHELLKGREAMVEGSLGLVEAGFDVRYANYPESLSSSRNCAKHLSDILCSWDDLKPNLYLIAYSFGILVALELLEDKAFRPLRERVKSVVSLCGSVNGPPRFDEAEPPYCKNILDLFAKIKATTNQKEPGFERTNAEEVQEKRKKPHILEASLVKILKDLWTLETPWAEGIWKIVEMVGNSAEYLIDIPEGLELLGRANPRWTEPEFYPENCDLFSISAICPPSLLLRNSDLENKERGALRAHLDDIYLYLSSQHLYRKITPYNDTQFFYRDTRFPPSPKRNRHHLGTLKSHHWGVAFPSVLSTNFENPFPRRALMESIVLLLAEYYGIT